jgi:hypothetical protein
MELYIIFFYLLKIILFTLTAMVLLGIIQFDDNIYLLFNNFLKFCLGLFIIIYFIRNKLDNIGFHDKFFIIAAGFLLLFPNFDYSSSK